MGNSESKPKGHPLFAAVYDRLNAAADEGWQGERRFRLLSGVRGEVLEIGGGTGANLPHYRDADRVIVAEPDPFMRKRLRPKLSQAQVPVEISEAGAQELPFAEDSFDAVVSTLVLCTVPEQGSALAEVRRVLRPGGALLFMEHVRSPGRIARWQDRVQPLWTKLFAGCHPNRDTVAAIEAAGFVLQDFERFDPPVPLSGFVPHVQGVAKVPVDS